MVMSFIPNDLIFNDDDEKINVDDDQDDSLCDRGDYEMMPASDLFEGTLDLEEADLNDVRPVASERSRPLVVSNVD